MILSWFSLILLSGCDVEILLTKDREALIKGQSTLLEWSIKPDTIPLDHVFLESNNGLEPIEITEVARDGSLEIRPELTTLYTIRALWQNQVNSQRLQVIVVDGHLYEFMHLGRDERDFFYAVTSDPKVIDQVESQLLLAENERDLHMNGIIQGGGGGHNGNWSWHFMPNAWRLSEVSIELCDGWASFVEEELDYWLRIGRFCPWGSRVKRRMTSSQ